MSAGAEAARPPPASGDRSPAISAKTGPSKPGGDIGTCIAHRINPRAYLHIVAKLIVNGFPNARLRELLPDRIATLHPELRLPAPAARAPSLPAPSLPAPS